MSDLPLPAGATENRHSRMLCSVADREAAFESAARRNVTVRNMLRAGFPLESIIVKLVDIAEGNANRIMALEAICPKKVVYPDGKTLVWHCPDSMIPAIGIDTFAKGGPTPDTTVEQEAPPIDTTGRPGRNREIGNE